MNENDLRVQRTRRLLREALIDLVNSQGYDHTTIRDITRKAQVGYKTFFRHYESKEALLHAILGELIEDFQQATLSPGALNAVEKNTLTALQFAAAHQSLLRAILNSPASEQLLTPLVNMGLQDGKRFLGGSEIPDELVSYHFATSMISLTRWWLENNKAYSVEEMAAYINQLLLRPIQHLE